MVKTAIWFGFLAMAWLCLEAGQPTAAAIFAVSAPALAVMHSIAATAEQILRRLTRIDN